MSWSGFRLVASIGCCLPVRSVVGDLWESATRAAFSSYLNPNARCPVCGASVFFYQSPHGGRVFFDELGPPWPKHPCTDNAYAQGARQVVVRYVPLVATHQPSWKGDGWNLFLCGPVTAFRRANLAISIAKGRNERTPQRLCVVGRSFVAGEMYFVKEVTVGRWAVSGLLRIGSDDEVIVATFEAYTTLDDYYQAQRPKKSLVPRT